MQLSTRELANGLGLELDAEELTITKAGAAAETISDLDSNLENMVRKSMDDPRASYEKAFDGFLRENPQAYELYTRARSQLLKQLGVQNVASDGSI